VKNKFQHQSNLKNNKMNRKNSSESISRRAFIRNGSIGTAALTTGFINPAFTGSCSGNCYPVPKLAHGASDNETLQRAKNWIMSLIRRVESPSRCPMSLLIPILQLLKLILIK